MRITLLIPTLILTLFSCTTTSDKAPLKEGVLARVFNHNITQEDFDRKYDQSYLTVIPSGYQLSDKEINTFKTQVLNSMIQKYMYTVKMDQLNIQGDYSIIEKQIEEAISQFESKEHFLKYIESVGYTYDELVSEILYDTRLHNLSIWIENQNFTVSDKEILDYYNSKLESDFSKSGRVSARHILIMTEDKSNEEALKLITEIRNDIINGLDFSEAAKKYSEGPSGPKGGILPPFTTGQMVKEFETASYSLPLKSLSEPILTKYGYHLILVDSREETIITPIEDVKEYIKTTLINQNFFEDLKKEAEIVKIEWVDEEK